MKKTKHFCKKRSHFLFPLLLVIPAFLIRGFTTIYPLFTTFYNSLFDLSIFRSSEAEFVGLGNFIEFWGDHKFISAAEFTAFFTIVSMLFHLILGVLLALPLNAKFAGKRFIRTIVLIPWAMPMVVAGYAARWAFDDTYGLINDLIRRVLPNFHCDWLVQARTARLAVISVDLWKDVPFFAILVLASLQFITEDIYEAARIDGSSSFQSFFYITLPSIAKTLFTLSIFFTLWRMTSFDVVYCMTSGGPGSATTLLAYRIMLEAFTNINLGTASALAVILFLAMIIISLFNLKLAKRFD